VITKETAYRKGAESDQGVYLFLSTSTDEVIWWIVQRYREEIYEIYQDSQCAEQNRQEIGGESPLPGKA
jgi:hypothetical protein